AAGGILPVLGGPDRWAFAVVLLAAAVLLGAFAFGFSPWRRNRTRRILALVALGSLVLVACGPPPQAAAPPGNGPTQPPITSRAAWGARGFSCAGGPQSAPSLKFAVVHHTAGPNNYNPGDTPSILRGIQAYHMDTLGYCDIAYNFLIDQYGQIFEGRAGGITNPIIGGHAGGFNTSSAGVSLVGDYTGSTPPAAEWNSLVSLLAWRLRLAGVNPAAGFSAVTGSSPCNCMNWAPGTPVSFPSAIVGHRDVDKTSCPGNSFYPQLQTLRDQVQTAP
ncbi:MAG: peptidoglycan recognition protein, partial [Acidimicrobiia bacterium]|nr:peptidoglycan recognition protein [Acidimicrobiia bacterium]